MNKWFKRYVVDALGGMALGLFSTLIIGLIIKQIGGFFPIATDDANGFIKVLSAIGSFCIKTGNVLTVLTGVGIAVGTAHALQAPKLVLYSSILSGTIGAYASKFLAGSLFSETGAIILAGPGDPLSAFIATVIGAEIGRLISGKTKIDIIVTPAVTVLAGGIAAIILGPPLAQGSTWLGMCIMKATELQPFWMGIIISIVMGMILTLPISSAAIAIILGLSGLAGGAATAGCCAQMIGFAVISFKDNGINGFLAQGLGTSMLQIPNIAKNPRIWIPSIVASAIIGPIATVACKMTNLPGGSGMGTSGLVGILLTWESMIGTQSGISIILKILILYIILPGVLSYLVYLFMYKKGWIKDGDMKLSTL